MSLLILYLYWIMKNLKSTDHAEPPPAAQWDRIFMASLSLRVGVCGSTKFCCLQYLTGMLFTDGYWWLDDSGYCSDRLGQGFFLFCFNSEFFFDSISYASLKRCYQGFWKWLSARDSSWLKSIQLKGASSLTWVFIKVFLFGHQCYAFRIFCQLLHKVQKVAASLTYPGILPVQLKLLVGGEYSHCSIYLGTVG